MLFVVIIIIINSRKAGDRVRDDVNFARTVLHGEVELLKFESPAG
jgi:hypothetical protein